MTEQEWISSTDPAAMLGLFRSHHIAGQFGTPARFGLSDRKLRLFACACCELAGLVTPAKEGEMMASSHSGALAWAAEWAGANANEGRPSQQQKADLLREIVGSPFRTASFLPLWRTADVLALGQACYEERPGRRCAACNGTAHVWSSLVSGTRKCTNCIAGRIEDGLLDPVRLTILADALEEAGCPAEVKELSPGWFRCRSCGKEWLPIHKYDDCDGGAPCEGIAEPITVRYVPHPILAHLRSPGPHVRGMWSLDLILAKE